MRVYHIEVIDYLIEVIVFPRVVLNYPIKAIVHNIVAHIYFSGRSVYLGATIQPNLVEH
jgi:hypothetical protein